MSSPHLPERTPTQIRAAMDALAVPGDCCPHGAGLHTADGTCALVGVRQCSCPGWRPRPLAGRTTVGRYCTDPTCNGLHREGDLGTAPGPRPGNGRVIGVENTDLLPCSTPGCGHPAGVHRHDRAADSGLGACTACDCVDWTYTIADDDVVDAEVLDPLGDVMRSVLTPYVGATWTPDAVDAAVIAITTGLEQHTDDVAAYFRLDSSEARAGWELLADVVNAGDLSLTALAAALERARAQIIARGLR